MQTAAPHSLMSVLSRRARSVVPVTLAALLATMLSLVTLAAPASAVPPQIAVSLSGGTVLAGENSTHTITATNTGAIDGYNLALVLDVPEGIEFVSSDLGTPMIYSAANPPAEELPEGMQRWVWEDVSDLPASGAYSATVTVHAVQPPQGTGETSDVSVSPVGADYTLTAYAGLSGDPTYLPVFNGSTGVGTAPAIAETSVSAPAQETTRVVSLRISKSEQSPESELLRGVHNETTVYTLSVRATTEGATENAVMVDFLPAGLEFLGCGDVDNSTVDRAPGDAEVNEYEGAPPLWAIPDVTADCLTPTRVSTILADATLASQHGLVQGAVYTQVEWELGTLAAGSVTTIRYAAGIPLRENTLTWDGADGAPTPETLGQAANLDNNNGPSTRHGSLTEAVDGGALRNVATVTGDYLGVVRTGTTREVMDSATATVHAMDLRILKDLDAADRQFQVGNIADYTLTLRASEYMQASDIVITDEIPNGLCPLLPAGASFIVEAGAPAPADCDGVGVITGAELVSAAAHPDGTFTLVLRPTAGDGPDDFVLAPDAEHVITYQALNRGEYVTADEYGPTTSGDRFGNTVSLTAATDAIEPILADHPQTYLVWDDSDASIGTDYTTISKRVMPRTEVQQGLAAGEDPCTAGAFSEDTQGDFRLGDTVCFELRVNFPSSIDVRNPVVTDFLPNGLTYAGHALAAENTVSAATVSVDASGATAGRVEWRLGTPGEGGDRYVPRGHVFVVHVWATVDAPSNGLVLDKPANLMKYRQQNVYGELYFLRDAADVLVDPELQLVKGVESVLANGSATWEPSRPAGSAADGDGTVFLSNRDGIEVREGETVRYRIDLHGLPYEAVASEIWDVLPDGVRAADVSAISHEGVAYDPADAGHPQGDGDAGTELAAAYASRSVIIWKDVVVPDTGTTLTYDVTVPVGIGADSSLTNIASIITYRAGVNTSPDPDAQLYIPGGSLNTALAASANTDGTGTTDASEIHLPGVTVDKTVTSPTGLNNQEDWVVHGEEAHFAYSVTIPAHTSVRSATLRDVIGTPGNWQIVSATSYVEHPGGQTTPGSSAAFSVLGSGDFAFDPATGLLTFPGTYTNETDAPQTFTVHLTAYVKSTASWTHNTSTERGDTARFQSSTTGQVDAPAHVHVIEPNPSISKTVSSSTVSAGQTVTYTLTATNAANRPSLFDTVVTDCVPVELEDVTLGAASQGSATIVADDDCDGTLIVWTVGTLETGTPATLQFTAQVSSDAAGGATYTNTANLVGYGLDDEDADRKTYSRTGSRDITVRGASLTKSVDQSTAVIGEERTFTVTATIPADVNFYDAVIVDDVPASMAISNVTITCRDASDADCMAQLPGGGATLTEVDGLTGWWLGDIASSPSARTVTVTYTGTVLDIDSTEDGDQIVNRARMRWNIVDTLTEPPSADFTGTASTSEASATVTVQESALSVVKKVNGLDSATVEPGDEFDYAVTVRNTGSAAAYDVTVVDEIPAGVIVDTASVSHGGVLSGAGATGGGTITWTLASIDPSAPVDLTYTATLAESPELDDATLTNTVTVEEYFSHPTGNGYDDGERRSYDGPSADADVTPGFPVPTIAKGSSTALALIGVPITFTLTIANNGTGASASTTVVDTLPLGWEYVPDSTVLDGDELADPDISTSPDGEQVLTWTSIGSVVAGDAVSLTYAARPSSGHAWTSDNTGADVAHTNVAHVQMTDAGGFPQNAVREYRDDSDASVYIHEADLEIAKEHTGAIVAGSSVTWTVTVTNNGPDTSAGPFMVTDWLPADAEFTAISGPGWEVVGMDDDNVLGLRFTGSLGVDESTSVQITAAFAADVEKGTDATNAACVYGTTFDPDPANDCAQDEAEVDTLADVALVKELADEAFTAGEPIAWTIEVSNNGPSISHAPFTVKDQLSPKVDWDTVIASGDGWECGEADGLGIVTCVWEGNPLGVGESLPILTLQATVLTSATGTIVNTATVTPTTAEPATPGASNNTDTATLGAVDTLADLALTKSVVSDELVAGGTGRYRIEVANGGPSDALDVVVTDRLPEGVSYLGALTSAAGDTWVCEPSATVDGQVDCALTSGLGILAAGDSTWFEFDVDIASSVTGQITNGAVVTSDTPDPDLDDNEDEVTQEPLVETNILVTKSHDSGLVYRAGDRVEFTITVSNDGLADAADVVVTDVLPDAVEYLDVDDDAGWTVTENGDGTVELTLDEPLPAGESASITLVVLLTADAVPGFTNVVTVATSTTETDDSDNRAEDPVEVDSPDLVIVKTADAELVQGGDTFTYTLTVSNVDDDAHADTVRVDDEIPFDLKVVTDVDDIGGDDWACVLVGTDADGFGGTLTCFLDTLDAGATAPEIAFEVLVAADVARDVISNTAVVSSNDEHLDLVDELNEGQVALDVKWIRFSGASVCIADVPWFQYTIEPRNLDERLPITLTWYADHGADGTPDGAAVAVQTLPAVTGTEPVSDQILWPGAAVDEHGIGTAWPGMRPITVGETPTWKNYIEDPSLPEHSLRGGALVVVSINPESSVTTAYPLSDADCEVLRNAELDIEKEALGVVHHRSESVTFVITVSNTSYGATDDVVMRDPIPSSLKVTDIQPAASTDPTVPDWRDCDVTGQDADGYGGVVECVLDGWLGYGQSAPDITLVTAIRPGTPLGTLTNVASVYWTDPDEPDSPVYEASAEADITLVLSADELLANTGVQVFGLVWLASLLAAAGVFLQLLLRRRREA